MTPTQLATVHAMSPLPALIAGAGDRAALRFLEYFTVNIRNKNTRAAYARAAADFSALMRWAGERGQEKPTYPAFDERSGGSVRELQAC